MYALMLVNEFTELESGFGEKFLNELKTAKEGEVFLKENTLSEINQLRKAGFNHPYMERIEKFLK
jgi:hypothetical protein